MDSNLSSTDFVMFGLLSVDLQWLVQNTYQ